MSSKNSKSEKKKREEKLEVINTDVAGIDVGDKCHYVSVPPDRDSESIRRFEGFTDDLYDLVNWLKKCGIKSVAMESTGVYWIPIFEVIDRAGIKVLLVNARQIKNVSGKKTDVADCEWIRKLHMYGLLQGSFRPSDEIVEYRGYVRQRDGLVKEMADAALRMQKALKQMNINLSQVITSIVGVTGLRIIAAIIEGERSPDKLLTLVDRRIMASKDRIRKSLIGNYRNEHIFALKIAYDQYQFYKTQLADVEKAIEQSGQNLTKKMQGSENADKDRNKSQEKQTPSPSINTILEQIAGCDLTKIPGISTLTAQIIIAEAGTDMSKWETAGHFASWLGLCPNNKVTGEKIHGNRTRKVKNRLACALRQSAVVVGQTQSALGGYYRRMRGRIGGPKAVTATAHKLACLIYRLMRYGEKYVESGMQKYEEDYKKRQMIALNKNAQLLGMNLVPAFG